MKSRLSGGVLQPTYPRMKISYVTTYDASDVSHWSGSGHFVATALENQGFELDRIGPLPVPMAFWPVRKAKGLVYNRIFKQGYRATNDLTVARHYASVLRQYLARHGDTDLIFSPGSIPIAFLETDLPIAFWSDATYGSLVDFYPEYSQLCAESLRAGHRIEQSAIDKASAVILTSHWAAESAIRDYHADPAKVHVVPFGANIENPPELALVERAVRSRPRHLCKLLFIGVDWVRKGGETAMAVAEELNRTGLPTELTVIGCNPFPGQTQPEFVRCEGFLHKDSPEEARQIERFLSESHFLIVPSLAECFGLVYCEANAYGVPCLARSVGGVPSIIHDGINGKLFTPNAPASDFAGFIKKQFQDYDTYIQFALSSAREFESRLNWNVTGEQVRNILLNIDTTKRGRRPTSNRKRTWVK